MVLMCFRETIGDACVHKPRLSSISYRSKSTDTDLNFMFSTTSDPTSQTCISPVPGIAWYIPDTTELFWDTTIYQCQKYILSAQVMLAQRLIPNQSHSKKRGMDDNYTTARPPHLLIQSMHAGDAGNMWH